MQTRYQILTPYRGSEIAVDVSVSETRDPRYLFVEMPNGRVITIEQSELDLLIRCGLAKRLP